MARTKEKHKKTSTHSSQADSAYFLKLLLYLMIGSLWLKIENETMQFGFPVGLALGLLFATHEHFRIDRKIEFAVLLVAMFVGYLLPSYGLYVSY